LETDVFQRTGRRQGGTVRERTEAVDRLVERASSQPPTRETGEPVEETIRRARAVPDEAAGDIADALAEEDATIFGSAAAAAQTRQFRQPRDLDIAAPDESSARQTLSRALEGENADVGDIFDIKEVEDVPGRARAGEQIKFAQESQPKIETERGVQVNPVEEELLRKAGASGFFRGPDAAGTDRFDVGPQERATGDPRRTDVRQKDVEDTDRLAREVLGEDDPALREFRDAFGVRDGRFEPDEARRANRADVDAERGLTDGIGMETNVGGVGGIPRVRNRGQTDLAPGRRTRGAGGPDTRRSGSSNPDSTFPTPRDRDSDVNTDLGRGPRDGDGPDAGRPRDSDESPGVPRRDRDADEGGFGRPRDDDGDSPSRQPDRNRDSPGSSPGREPSAPFAASPRTRRTGTASLRRRASRRGGCAGT